MSLWEWVKWGECYGNPEFEKCATIYRHWSIGILNVYKYGYTNGPVEGLTTRSKYKNVLHT